MWKFYSEEKLKCVSLGHNSVHAAVFIAILGDY